MKPLHPPLWPSHAIPRSSPLSLRRRGLFSSLLRDSNSIPPPPRFCLLRFCSHNFKISSSQAPSLCQQIPVSHNLKTNTTFLNLALPSSNCGKLPSSYWYTCWGNWLLLSQSLHSHCSFTSHLLLIWCSVPLPHWVSSLKRQQTTRSTNPLTYLQSSFSPTHAALKP